MADSRRGPARAGWLERHRKAFDEAVRELRRRPLASLATVAVVAVALALPALAWLARDTAAGIAGEIRAEPEISIILEPPLDEADAEAVAREYLDDAAPAFITGWRLLDRETVLQEFRDTAGVAVEQADLGEDNPVPLILVAAVDAAAAEPVATDEWARRLRSDGRVAHVLADTGWLARLRSLAALAGRGMLVVGLGLLGTVLLVVGQALRAQLEQRATAVEVAKLCGASDAFVRRPFVYGGLALGGLGGVFAVLLVAVAVATVATPVLSILMEFESEYSLTVPALLIAALLPVAGAGLGVAGALLTVNGRIREIAPR